MKRSIRLFDLRDDIFRQDIETAAVLPEEIGKLRDLIALLIDDKIP